MTDSDIANSRYGPNMHRLDYSLFTPEFSYEIDDINKEDRRTMVEYILENRDVTSPLIIGWEVAERLYQNERRRDFYSKRVMGKLMYLLCLPIEIVTYFIIMPNVDPETKFIPKLRLIINPIFNSYFLAYVLTHGGSIQDLNFLGIFFVNFVVTIIIVFPVVFNEILPTENFYKFVFTNNLVMSLLSFYAICDIIVELFKSLHIIFNFKYVFFTVALFSTVVWVPAIGGAIKTTQYMKIVPGYNGAIFNTLFVFGLCVMIHQLFRGEIKSHMWPLRSDLQSDTVTAFFLINSAVLPITYWLMKSKDFRYTRAIGFFLTTFYIVVNSIVLVIGFLYVY